MDLFKNLAQKLKNTKNKWTQGISNLFSDEPISDSFWEELEELLVSAMSANLTKLMKAQTKAIDERIAHRI